MAPWAQRSKLSRLGAIGALGLLIVCGSLLISVQVRERIIRSRSEALYSEFLKLRPGETTKADVESLRSQWAGKLPEEVSCEGFDCEYEIGDLWGSSRWFLLTQFAHDHAPSSALTLETKGNLLAKTSFSAGVLVPRGYGTRAERDRTRDPNYVPYSSGRYLLFGRVTLDSALPDLGYVPDLMAASGYRIGGPSGCMNCLAIFVSALPSLEPARRSQLFQIDFGCMTRWSVCTDKEDIMPLAALEKAKERELADHAYERPGQAP